MMKRDYDKKQRIPSEQRHDSDPSVMVDSQSYAISDVQGGKIYNTEFRTSALGFLIGTPVGFPFPLPDSCADNIIPQYPIRCLFYQSTYSLIWNNTFRCHHISHVRNFSFNPFFE